MSESVAPANEAPATRSIALAVFLVHIAFSLLLWFSNDHGELSDTANAALIALLFPLYIAFAHPPDLPDSLSLLLLIAMWLVSAVIWTGIVITLLWAFRKARAKLI
jgi:lipopolysaccharide export LptBFGC system permease protein LptF